MKTTSGCWDVSQPAGTLPHKKAFRAVTAGAGSHNMRARILSYGGFSNLYLKNRRIMSGQSARFARGSDDRPKGHNHPKWDILRGFSSEFPVRPVQTGNSTIELPAHRSAATFASFDCCPRALSRRTWTKTLQRAALAHAIVQMLVRSVFICSTTLNSFAGRQEFVRVRQTNNEVLIAAMGLRIAASPPLAPGFNRGRIPTARIVIADEDIRLDTASQPGCGSSEQHIQIQRRHERVVERSSINPILQRLQ